MPNLSAAPTPPCVLRLIELSRASWEGDTAAQAQLRLAGELLDFAGGARALCDAQGQAHDWLLAHRDPAGRDLAGHIGSHWEHIPSWAGL